MQTRDIRLWSLVHRWSSLVCTVFMLLLCLTGLPLIFHHEIDHWTGHEVEAPAVPVEQASQRVSLDQVMAVAQRRFPELQAKYAFMAPDDDRVWHVTLGSELQQAGGDRSVVVDARTGEVLAQPQVNEGFMHVMLRLHVDLFAGLPGMLFLGFMGCLLVVSLVSGLVLYAPFMRKLDFGTVRRMRTRRLKWLDLHNLIGASTAMWVLVVGLTGVVNTLSLPMVSHFQNTTLAHINAPFKDRAPLSYPQQTATVQAMCDRALDALPGREILYVAFPGTVMATPGHMAVYLRGRQALTSRLAQPVFLDAATGALSDVPDMPWYLTALLISQPLHFGDYGGLPLKLLWAAMDAWMIVVLGSGLYLWLRKRRESPPRQPAATVQSGGRVVEPGRGAA